MSDQSQKPDLIILIVFFVALLGVAGEAIFYNYTFLGNVTFKSQLYNDILNTIYQSKHFIKYGIAWRIFYITATIGLIYVFKVSKEPNLKKQPYYISLVVSLSFILFCKLVWLAASSQSTVLIGDVLLICGLITFPFSLIQLKKGFEFNQNVNDLPFLNQVKRKVTNEFSINWKTKDGYVNVLNPFRGISIVGGPGSGKSFTLIEEIIQQLLDKGFTACIYDFKAFTLGTYAYNVIQAHNKKKKFSFETIDSLGKKVIKEINTPKFYLINFKDVRYSHRCNPLHPSIINSSARVNEAAQAVLFNLNKDWIKKGTDFFSGSAIAYLTSIILFLKSYQEKTGEEVCSLPHAIALAVQNVEEVVEILVNDEEGIYGAAPIKAAVDKGALEQLAGVVATLQNAIGKLAIKEIFWVMTGSDFTLDLNNPEDPKIICIGNDDGLSRVFAPALSLYLSMISKTINQKGKLPCAFIMDEFPTVYIPGIDQLPNTGRSNKISTVVAMQDYGQLDRDYGKEEARVLKAGLGNVFVGEVTDPETAKFASELLGKQYEEKVSYNINPSSTSHTINRGLESIMPVSKIQQLNQGEFVGKVSDLETINGDVKKDDTKLFNSKFIINKPKHNKEIPQVYIFDEDPELNDKAMKKELDDNFKKITADISRIKDSVYWDIIIKRWMLTNPNTKYNFDHFTEIECMDMFLTYIKPTILQVFNLQLIDSPTATLDAKKKMRNIAIVDVYEQTISQFLLTKEYKQAKFNHPN